MAFVLGISSDFIPSCGDQLIVCIAGPIAMPRKGQRRHCQRSPKHLRLPPSNDWVQRTASSEGTCIVGTRRTISKTLITEEGGERVVVMSKTLVMDDDQEIEMI